MADTPQQIAERFERFAERVFRELPMTAAERELLPAAVALLRAVLEPAQTCGNCQHWKDDLPHKPDLGWCTNRDSMASAGHFGSSKNYTEADDGCVLHWSAKP